MSRERTQGAQRFSPSRPGRGPAWRFPLSTLVHQFTAHPRRASSQSKSATDGQRPLNPAKANAWTPRQITFPNPDHAPTHFPQRAIHSQIPLSVRRKFAPPERPIILWLGGVLGAAVPETAINEHREFEFQKNKVWLSKNGPVASPAADAMPPHQHRQRQFRILVPAPVNPRHHFRPLYFSENVRHFCSELDKRV